MPALLVLGLEKAFKGGQHPEASLLKLSMHAVLAGLPWRSLLQNFFGCWFVLLIQRGIDHVGSSI
jgi:hypothetical protein